MAALQIRQARSPIGKNMNQRATLHTLGLKKIGDTTIRQDTTQVRGMIHAVSHLIDVESVANAEDS